MCGMTSPSVGLRRLRRSITPQATDEASIRRGIWPPSPASCRPIATVASSRCSTRRRRRKAQPIAPAFCFAHARRGFFELADIEKNAREGKKGKPVSPIALEAVKRFDALFEIERAINGHGAGDRRAVRQEQSKPLLQDMQAWLLRERETLSRSSEVLKPINYMLRRWDGFARFLDDGRICLTNNCAERALRGIALGRRNWTFAGSERGADRAATMLTMITTCRLNEVDPKAWLADVLARIADHPASRLNELLPWEWKLLRQADKPADQQAA
jgi:transposase